MAAIGSALLSSLGLTQAERAFRPWWDAIEDHIVYTIIILVGTSVTGSRYQIKLLTRSNELSDERVLHLISKENKSKRDPVQGILVTPTSLVMTASPVDCTLCRQVFSHKRETSS